MGEGQRRELENWVRGCSVCVHERARVRGWRGRDVVDTQTMDMTSLAESWRAIFSQTLRTLPQYWEDFSGGLKWGTEA